MSPSSSPATTPAMQAVDAFYPSGFFAKVPAEALGILAFEGPHRMEHTEFRLFVALCRFRGRAQVVNPCQETLAKMTGMARNNVSRAAHSLQAKGWVRLHHKEGNPRKAIENYELLIPTPGTSPGVATKPRKAPGKVASPQTPAHAHPTLPAAPLVHAVARPAYESLPDCAEFDAAADDAHYGDHTEIDSEPMTSAELEEALTQLELQEA